MTILAGEVFWVTGFAGKDPKRNSRTISALKHYNHVFRLEV
jgi:hypothetical protein